MSTKTLLIFMSVVEILFLVAIDILGNKLAELIHLDSGVILGLTFILATILVWITVYKFRISDAKTIAVSLPTPKIRITQHGVKKFVWWMGYGPAALLLSVGAFYLSRELEREWQALLSSIVVSITLFAYPAFRRQAAERGNKVFPILIAWILAVIYGGVGFYLLSFPEFLKSHIIPFIWLSAITMTGLKYAYIFHILEAIIEPWYKKLPEN